MLILFMYRLYIMFTQLTQCNLFHFNHGSNLSQIIWKSNLEVDVDKNDYEKLTKLFNSLEDNEDVQSISSNVNNKEEIFKDL